QRKNVMAIRSEFASVVLLLVPPILLGQLDCSLVCLRAGRGKKDFVHSRSRTNCFSCLISNSIRIHIRTAVRDASPHKIVQELVEILSVTERSNAFVAPKIKHVPTVGNVIKRTRRIAPSKPHGNRKALDVIHETRRQKFIMVHSLLHTMPINFLPTANDFHAIAFDELRFIMGPFKSQNIDSGFGQINHVSRVVLDEKLWPSWS